ncbi:NAD(P)H-binding protein [Streptomyces sp. DSM 44917]|uniref:NAD(P)H-binding protein n=1 Tax=Streptomyces boetiae TaxID=3075541 RepID=A0ABU2LAV3_9ACTN|nr:NAD(P)H-binding protein [Streptomyces sp. DSM 44917]MDT0308591.1 NAD(P)H-binding protein [Streptomyces sp. DSM 44917]
MASIAVFGANGAIGHRIVSEALDRGHEVTAVVRDPAQVSRTHPSLTVTAGDVLDPASVSAVGRGRDAVVSAVGGGNGAGHQALIRPSAESLVAGLHALGSGAPRLIMVGGAGSLRTPGGGRLMDTPGLPEDVLLIMRAHGDALEYLRGIAGAGGEVRWTNVSPAADIRPGRRTGGYRTALEDLVTDAHGASRISAEDYAVAIVDEIERPAHLDERFTVGY